MTPDEARQYLLSTAQPGGTMRRQGPELALSRMQPEFAAKLAAAIQQARAEGINASVYSSYRPPAYNVGGFKGGVEGKFNSLHSYGLATDIAGIGSAGSATAKRWHEIAVANGIFNPYGPNNPKEWNHYQAVPEKGRQYVAAHPELRASITAQGPVDLDSMWAAAGLPVTAAPDPFGVAKLQSQGRSADRSLEARDERYAAAQQQAEAARVAQYGQPPDRAQLYARALQADSPRVQGQVPAVAYANAPDATAAQNAIASNFSAPDRSLGARDERYAAAQQQANVERIAALAQQPKNAQTNGLVNAIPPGGNPPPAMNDLVGHPNFNIPPSASMALLGNNQVAPPIFNSVPPPAQTVDQLNPPHPPLPPIPPGPYSADAVARALIANDAPGVKSAWDAMSNSAHWTAAIPFTSHFNNRELIQSEIGNYFTNLPATIQAKAGLLAAANPALLDPARDDPKTYKAISGSLNAAMTPIPHPSPARGTTAPDPGSAAAMAYSSEDKPNAGARALANLGSSFGANTQMKPPSLPPPPIADHFSVPGGAPVPPITDHFSVPGGQLAGQNSGPAKYATLNLNAPNQYNSVRPPAITVRPAPLPRVQIGSPAASAASSGGFGVPTSYGGFTPSGATINYGSVPGSYGNASISPTVGGGQILSWTNSSGGTTQQYQDANGNYYGMASPSTSSKSSGHK